MLKQGNRMLHQFVCSLKGAVLTGGLFCFISIFPIVLDYSMNKMQWCVCCKKTKNCKSLSDYSAGSRQVWLGYQSIPLQFIWLLYSVLRFFLQLAFATTSSPAPDSISGTIRAPTPSTSTAPKQRICLFRSEKYMRNEIYTSLFCWKSYLTGGLTVIHKVLNKFKKKITFLLYYSPIGLQLMTILIVD